MHLHQNTTQTPHVDRCAVLKTKHHFRRAIESALDVLVHPLVGKARTAKINHLDGTLFRVSQQNVLWLQIAVDHIHFGQSQKTESVEKLLSKFANQVQ